MQTTPPDAGSEETTPKKKRNTPPAKVWIFTGVVAVLAVILFCVLNLNSGSDVDLSSAVSITIQVVDQATRGGIAGCIVEVWHQNGSLVNSYTSDRTGVIETQKLDNGFYVLKLVKVADGYTATITEATVEVKDASEVTYTFELISNGRKTLPFDSMER